MNDFKKFSIKEYRDVIKHTINYKTIKIINIIFNFNFRLCIQIFKEEIRIKEN